jgi:AcrR family transcriptional regulator
MEARERILLKANELFNRYGFRRVTMDEIALKTGMSKKTIYQSFENKDEIVNAIVEQHINKSATLCESNLCVAENAIHEVFLNMEMVQKLTEDMHPSIFEDLEKYYPIVFEKLFRHKNDFISYKISQNMKRGIEEGLYREEINIDILTKLRIETMFLPFNQQLFPYSKYKLGDIEFELIEHFIYGIATPKGQKLFKKYKEKTNKTL